MSEFLEKLKKAADNGEFNSEAAKKITEVTELAETKFIESDDGVSYVDTTNLDKLKDEVNKNIKPVTEEKALELNTEYEEKMKQLKKIDSANKQLATLIDIEDMVKASIEDMIGFTDELEGKFEKEFNDEDPIYADLSQKIEQIKSKYIIN